MAKRNTESIREREAAVARLTERADGFRGDISRHEGARNGADRKLWNLTIAFLGAFPALFGGLAVVQRILLIFPHCHSARALLH